MVVGAFLRAAALALALWAALSAEACEGAAARAAPGAGMGLEDQLEESTLGGTVLVRVVSSAAVDVLSEAEDGGWYMVVVRCRPATDHFRPHGGRSPAASFVRTALDLILNVDDSSGGGGGGAPTEGAAAGGSAAQLLGGGLEGVWGALPCVVLVAHHPLASRGSPRHASQLLARYADKAFGGAAGVAATLGLETTKDGTAAAAAAITPTGAPPRGGASAVRVVVVVVVGGGGLVERTLRPLVGLRRAAADACSWPPSRRHPLGAAPWGGGGAGGGADRGGILGDVRIGGRDLLLSTPLVGAAGPRRSLRRRPQGLRHSRRRLCGGLLRP